MTPTGRYRFRAALFGFMRALQQEWMSEDSLEWRDVPRSKQSTTLVFAIVRPSEWLKYAESQKLADRVALAERRAEIARNSRNRRKGEKPEFEASRLG